MRFVRFTTSGTPEWGVLDGDDIHALNARPSGSPTLEEIGDPTTRDAIARDVERKDLPTIPADSVSLLAPARLPARSCARD